MLLSVNIFNQLNWNRIFISFSRVVYHSFRTDQPFIFSSSSPYFLSRRLISLDWISSNHSIFPLNYLWLWKANGKAMLMVEETIKCVDYFHNEYLVWLYAGLTWISLPQGYCEVVVHDVGWKRKRTARM